MKYRTIGIKALAVSALMLLAPLSPSQAAGYTEDHRGAVKQIRKMLKKGQIPTSMKCANPKSAGNFLKPEVAFKAAPNKDKRDWRAFAYYGQGEWFPMDKKLKKRYKKVLSAPGSGRRFYCTLWIGPKGSLRR